MLFPELKEFFESAELPKTLDGGFIYYNDVKASAERAIRTIERHIEKHGTKGIRRSALPSAARANLQTLFDLLQDRSKWNVEKPEKFNSPYHKMKLQSSGNTIETKPKETKKTLEHLRNLEQFGAVIDYNQRIIRHSGLPTHTRKAVEFVKKKGFLTEKMSK
jgi:hypothetical protein